MVRLRCRLHIVFLMALIVGLPWFQFAWADLDEGLVAYYPFDGNASDESGNGNHGTVNEATLTEDRFGNADSAYSFDGDQDYIVMPRNGFNKHTGTVGMWIKPNDLSKTNGLWSIYYNDLNRIVFLSSNERLVLRIRYPIGTILSGEFLEGSSSNEWHYVVMTYDFINNAHKLYQNGILLVSTDIDYEAMDILPSEMYIGIYKDFDDDDNDGSPLEFGFFGSIDDVRIYNRALSECEIQSLYTGKDECISRTACQLYGVHDQGLNNTQFFTISPETFEVKALGDMKKAHDIEALDIHPQTAELFAASGKDTNIKGHLYQLNAQTGKLTSIGSTGFKEIDGLSFHPDGTLWGWATGDGLITIDTTTGEAELVVGYPGEVEDLTWNMAGTLLFGIENEQDNPDSGIKLLAYDGNTVKILCEELTQSLEIEALDTLPDDTLIFGRHGNGNLPLGVMDVTNCQILAEQKITTHYNDVEGIAWPTKTCTPQNSEP